MREEKEIDVINFGSNTTGRRKQGVSSDDYLEDWDSRKPRRRVQSGTRNSRTREAYRESSDQTFETSEDRPGRQKQRRDKNNQTHQRNRKEKKKKSGFKRILIILLIIVILLAAGLYYLVGVAYDKMNYEEIPSVSKESLQEDGVVNILLIGNDSRENGEDGRSDAMILLSISKKTKKIYMTSLLRDMYVEIPGHDGNRLNAAYSYGGAELLMQTIEQNLGIEVNRYVLVNFEAFANLVDAVKGVDLELTNDEVVLVNGYLWEYNILLGRPEGTDYFDTSLSGMIHLNGAQALAYTRNRYIGTDFGRTERQRKVLTAVIKKLPGAIVTNPKGLIDGLMPNLTTNLTKSECYRLSLVASKLLTYDLEPSSIPMEGTYKDANIRGMAVLEVDFEANHKYLMENVYGENRE
ncbi:MAG: LCP family protein [Lachnospiraceae bacterium]|nr:LCP family protein [Lachnospiraceae bacterium]